MTNPGVRALYAAAALAMVAPAPHSVAWAQGAAGAWQGRYVCGQGTTGLLLTVRAAGESDVEALFRFYPVKGNPGVPEGCFEMSGRYDPATREVSLSAGQWLLRPPGYITVDLSGTLSADGGTLSGTVHGPLCTRFELRRVPMVPRSTIPACQGYDVTVSYPAE